MCLPLMRGPPAAASLGPGGGLASSSRLGLHRDHDWAAGPAGGPGSGPPRADFSLPGMSEAGPGPGLMFS